ncbi:hypothetical protein A6U87_14730 [Rhizobium sp. AC44/96]|uniref:phage tail tape measure protein n=1 Tax=Rhizobium sp. AC44/96 TaxID=1841654 RepID=UPI0008100611|nr:phage tail tape measure protein [Rhizobium sp. AC44/96]OCJ05260.1 hypothetical protein A6U87_14730 [Rhizobium sp. AC44/96]
MAGEDQLLFSLEARINEFEKNLQKARRAGNDNLSAIERRAQRSADTLEKTFDKAGSSISAKLEGAFKPFLAGGVLAAGVTAAATALKEVAKSVAEVDREARKAGVSAKTWQQWAFVAKASGLEIDGVTDALKELNIRGDEFAKTGKGSAQEAFTRLGYTATDVAERLKDPSAFLDEIIGKLQKMNASAQTRILDETFGGQGAEQLAKLLGKSVDEIKKLRADAATFSDEQIESAKKIDAEFEELWRNATVYAKKAAIESVSYAGKIIDAISTLKGDKLIGRDRDAATDPEAQMKRLLDQRAKIVAMINDVESSSSALKPAELRQLQASLKAVDDQIADLGGGSDELKKALSDLSNITQNAASSFDHSAASAANFKSALAELKAFLPGLKAEMDTFGTVNGIESAYLKTVQNARTMGDVLNATSIRDRAITSARFGNATNLRDLVGAAEGTDAGRGYNETLGYGAFTGGAVNLTGMTIDQVLALQQQMLANPANTFNSSAVGRYQVTRQTLLDAMSGLGLTGDRLFNEDTQDAVFDFLHRRRGNDPAALRNEWEGLRNVDDATIRNVASATPTVGAALDPTPAQQKAAELTKQQDEARKSLNRTVQESLDLAQFENSISGLSANQQQIELGVFRAKQEAARAGITLSDQELNQIREKITATEQLNTANKQVQASSEGLADAQRYFAENFTSGLSGLLTGTQTLEGAVKQLANSLIDAALRAALLGEGPLAGLGGGKSSGGGSTAVGGLLGWLFSKDGGPVSHDRRTRLYLAGGGSVRGPGTSTSDSIPAMLSDGEFVVNARQTARYRSLLESINGGRVPALADGGAIGSSKAGTAGGGLNVGGINVSVNANGSTGDKAKDEQYSKDMGRVVAQAIDQQMTDWTINQMRPGGLFAAQRRR